MPSVCRDCPFLSTGPVLQKTRDQADAGHWVPCLQTVQPPRDGTLSAKIGAWRNEEGCRGARAWRRTKDQRI